MSMEYHVTDAIAQMKKREEPGLNYIYAKTYNYVYLRAKNILKRENDIQQLMRDVYLKMLESAVEIETENLYEWLGKTVYTMGCSFYRKKKAREAVCLELERNELTPHKLMNPEDTIVVMEDSLEQLPDLYQATFYAFYYDYMSVEEIAKVMDCAEGIILNRLNYTRKFMIRALEDYQEEKKIKVSFSVGAVCAALRKWSVDHCLGITVAQSVYTEICKEAKLTPSSIYLEGKDFAGVNHTVVYHKPEDFEPIEEQLALYGKKSGIDKKVLAILAGVVLLVAIVIAAVVLFGKSGDDAKEANPGTNQSEDVQMDDKADAGQADDGQAEDGQSGEAQPSDTPSDVNSDEPEYIFPESATRNLTREEVQGHTKKELRLGRNEIFARHGMIFGVEDLDAYFASKSWYQATIPASEFYDRVEMSLIEEQNIELIQEIESQM